MEFRCSNCDYSSISRQSVLRHIHRKNKCSPNPKLVKVPVKIKCEYCGKNLSTQLSLNRHYSLCKTLQERLKIESFEKDKEIAVLKAKLEVTGGNVTNSHNNSHNTTNNITNNINIQINSYDKTDYSKLTYKHYEYALNRVLMAVPQLIEFTHFNKKHPENHNVYISNYKGKYIKTYNGKDWEVKNKEESIDKIINDHEYKLEQWVEENCKEDPKLEDKFKYYLQVKQKDGAEKALREEVKLLLYNKRNKIIGIDNKDVIVD